ncbi:MAG: hypothetical protein KGL39_56475 [Patescibacteria group bacterium]|nr:hypothetical protein [Patescibacteria group bacterium]
MGTLDTFPLRFEDRKVKAPRKSLLRRGWVMLRMRKAQIQKHRQERREIPAALENLTDPLFLYHAENNQD